MANATTQISLGRRCGLLLGAVALLFAATPMAAAEADPQPSSAQEFVIANTFLTLAHELGHVLIDEYSVPIFGSEEDAADTIATIGILIEDRHQPNSQLAARILIAAQAWQQVWCPTGKSNDFRVLCPDTSLLVAAIALAMPAPRA